MPPFLVRFFHKVRRRPVAWIPCMGAAFLLFGPARTTVACWVAPSTRDVAELLHEATGGQVSDLFWEPSEGVLQDSWRGRRLLFLAQGEGRLHEVWCARVRLTLQGHPVAVAEAYNLTNTPLGEEHSLVASGRYAAFVNAAYGQEQGVTLLDRTGEAAPLEPWRWDARLRRSLTCWQETGRLAGIGRTNLLFPEPATWVKLALHADRLRVEGEDPHGRFHATIDLKQGTLLSADRPVTLQVERPMPKPALLWLVDTVRAIPWIGPAPIAWLEDQVFSARDLFHRLLFALRGETADLRNAAANHEEEGPAVVPSTSKEGDTPWPPAPLRSLWATTEPGEGVWKPRAPAWQKGEADPLPFPSPPAFVQTFVRPDRERPYVQVVLVAMDMRQLTLEVEAGSEDPQPLLGRPGPGHVPHDPTVYRRVVAGFNGAFKTKHGAYGMMVHKRILLPPQPRAATVMLLDDGRTALGSWGELPDLAGAPLPPARIVSLRQNLEPLLDRGVVNPGGRGLWGFTLPGTGVQTERSGLCVTAAGHLVYAWSDDVSALSLGRGMKAAGCTYGLHLDMNPRNTGFVFTQIDQLKTHRYRTEVLTPRMTLRNPARFVEYATKDFFYLLRRDPRPPAPGLVWTLSPGMQPAPSWRPGLWKSQYPTSQGTVELFGLDPTRLRFRVQSGTREPLPKTLAQAASSPPRRDPVLCALGLGTPQKPWHGLALDGWIAAPFSNPPAAHGTDRLAQLRIDSDGALQLHPASTPVPPHTDAVELPLLFDAQGEVHSPPSERVLRAALGIHPTGYLFVARLLAQTPSPLGEALRKVGCTQAVELRRGEATQALWRRASTKISLHAPAPDTQLQVYARLLLPGALLLSSPPPAEPGRQTARGSGGTR